MHADATQQAAVSEGQVYEVLTEKTIINWQGIKPVVGFEQHGSIGLQSGELAFDGNDLKAGHFVIDINSIQVKSIDSPDKERLEDHLKGINGEPSDDFFNMEKYPTGKFDIVSVSQSEDGNYMVKGNLTLKGISKEIDIPARIEKSDDNVLVKTDQFTINRTNWGLNYNSKNVIKGLGDNFIDDHVYLTLTMEAQAK